MPTEAADELQDRGVLGRLSTRWDVRPGDRVGTRSVVKTVTENDRGSHDPGDEQKTSHSWDDSITLQRRCEFGARRPDP